MEYTKVTIDLCVLENFKKQIERLKKENNELREELYSLDKEQLILEASEVALGVFMKYIEGTFSALGFKSDGYLSRDIDVSDELMKNLGKPHWRCDKFDVKLSARLSENWKSAFIRIGVSKELL